jgi:hypothetical protein
MKYLTKNTTATTVWKKILNSATTVTEESTSGGTKISSIIKPPVHIHGVKLLTWSRNFDFTPFKIKPLPSSSFGVPLRGSGRGTAP